MSYTHLTTTGRVKIKMYLELGMSIRSIARRLGRQPSTASRGRSDGTPTTWLNVLRNATTRAKTNCGAKTKLDDTMRRTIVSSLSNGKMEGTNNKIKLIKRRGYGYRTLERFFLSLYLEIGR
ncbi:MAG: transposase [Exiguobacterium sp.]|nr:transposase [Exiguobacterium sp.]